MCPTTSKGAGTMRKPVNKYKSHRAFKKARGRTRGENLAVARGGWRL